MIKYPVLIAILVFCSFLFPTEITYPETAAANFIRQHDFKISLCSESTVLAYGDKILAYAFPCSPAGFIVVCADDKLTPVIAYSDKNIFDPASPLASLIKSDLSLRLQNYDEMSKESKAAVKEKWNLLNSEIKSTPEYEQWPPEGSTTTGGWTETHWNQNAPYNKFCPMDLSANSRSYTGCPATAMSQLINFHRKINGTRFNSSDTYYHNYTQQFYIDTESRTYDFPKFTTVNVYLDSIEVKWSESRELNEDDIAALNWACGIATKSVFSAYGSGTFSVDQAYDAYKRFGFTSSVLMGSLYSDKDIKTKMADNIKIGLPVHLATVNETWTSGHNVVCDGYNSDDFFRLNFGWGGSSDGWYSLPEGFPYSLTVFEGIVADINLPTGIEDHPTIASGFELYQNYPNPFNPATEIKFSLADDAKVNLSVYNTNGQLVRTLLDGKIEKGLHTVKFNGEDLNSGIYFYSLEMNGNVHTRKMIMLK
jgi:hypothetical protein